jgi:CDP-6-deoxy-D-xylo-4-hexulose-3-dehydrase
MFRAKIDRISYGGGICGSEEREAMLKVYDSQGGKRWTIGPESEAFEMELSYKVGVKRSVVVNSGSSALLVALAALKLPKFSKVIIPAVNFPTAFNAIIQNNLIPYVIDVDINTLNLSLDDVAKAVQDPEVSAVIAVDIAGNVVDLPKLRQIVGNKVKIILDNCDGISSMLNGKYIDTYADVSCTSFHAAHIICLGEGGAIMTNDRKLADTCIKMREWGRASGTDKIYKYPGFPEDYRERYVYEEIGYNLKPLELQCAIGRVQLKRMEGFRKARLQNFTALEVMFEKYPQYKTISHLTNADPCWFSFPFLTDNRKKVMDTLEANNIEARTIFSGNILAHPAYKNITYFKLNGLPQAKRVMREGVFISVHPSVTAQMISFIDEVIGGIC